MVGGTIVTPPRKRLPAALAWVAVSPFAAWAAVRLAGLERGSIGTQLIAATPYAAAGSVVPLLLAALARRRAVVAVAAVTTAALGLSVLPRAFGTADAAPGTPLRVLTINMLVGRADPEAVVGLVRGLAPDVLSLQELTPGAVAALDAAGLAELLPHRVLRPDWSPWGSGLYARHRLTPLPGQDSTALVELPGGQKAEVVAVHPPAPLEEAVAVWERALEELPAASLDRLRILAGDFNATLDHAALRRVLARGYKDAAAEVGQGLVPTWPAHKSVLPPAFAIDHVLVDSRIGVRAVSVHTLPGTDHRAVFAELRLPQQGPGVVPSLQSGVEEPDVLG
ncbi:endonuclease/exonuclease/phosphatase family protein [Thermoactinospora rubra]|uniref:endonuclease/exonuclease/phosphatase family protein n=1 Tax=Thermoactinospora rubra TaxID=1088767 RepID=UPI000A0F83ED|nr:endonuclease/exonuclease/phosphatase family protein [Thermoactinospora rubra]